jgi:hypothetical protein
MTRALGAALVLSGALLGVGCSGGDDDDDTASDACHDGCVQTVAANCDNGPKTQEECESDCKLLGSGKCASQYEALQACAEGEQVTCNSAGLPTVSACSGETSAFVSCLN